MLHDFQGSPTNRLWTEYFLSTRCGTPPEHEPVHLNDRMGESVLHLGLPLLASDVLPAGSVWTAEAGATFGGYVLFVLFVGLNLASTPVVWAATTDQLSGLAAATGLALVNAMAQFAAMGLPPLVPRMNDRTGSCDVGILIATALAVGGLVGLKLAGRRRTAGSGAVPAQA